jgi:hypothetical protein
MRIIGLLRSVLLCFDCTSSSTSFFCHRFASARYLCLYFLLCSLRLFFLFFFGSYAFSIFWDEATH